MNQHVKTSLGVAVIIIIAITAGVFVWLIEKDKKIETDSQITKIEPVKNQPAPIETADEFANWQTYRNDKYEYEVKYPADKFTNPISFKNSGNPVAISSYDFKVSEMGIVQSGMDVNISVYNEGSSMDDVYKKATSFIDYNSSTKENTKFNEFTSINYTGSSRGDIFKGIIIQKNDSVMSLYVRHAPSLINVAEIFDKIISTLKFTNPSETATWQTYRNEKYGFEFKYPNENVPFGSIDEKNEKIILASTTSERVRIVENEKMLFCCEASGLDIMVLDGNVAPQDWLNNHQVEYFSESQKSHKKVIFAGKEAFEIYGGGNIGSKYRVLAMRLNNKMIVIIQDVNDEFSNKIISTLKFTK